MHCLVKKGSWCRNWIALQNICCTTKILCNAKLYCQRLTSSWLINASHLRWSFGNCYFLSSFCWTKQIDGSLRNTALIVGLPLKVRVFCYYCVYSKVDIVPCVISVRIMPVLTVIFTSLFAGSVFHLLLPQLDHAHLQLVFLAPTKIIFKIKK